MAYRRRRRTENLWAWVTSYDALYAAFSSKVAWEQNGCPSRIHTFLECADVYLVTNPAASSFGTTGAPSFNAIPWAGILNPSHAIDWSKTGLTIVGGIPVRNTVCATIAPYVGNIAKLNVARAQCPAGQVVLLSPAGTYDFSAQPSAALTYGLTSGRANNFVVTFTGSIVLDPSNNLQEIITTGTTGPSPPAWKTTPGGITVDGTVQWRNDGPDAGNGGQVTIRGLGASQTIIKGAAAFGSHFVGMGIGGAAGAPTATMGFTNFITTGAAKGSTQIRVTSAAGIGAGTFIFVTELMDTVNKKISATGDEGPCGQCTFSGPGQDHLSGQIDKVLAVNGNVLTLEEPLYDSYNNGPLQDWRPNHLYEAFEPIAVRATGHVYSQTVQYFNPPYYCISGNVKPTFPTTVGGTVTEGGASLANNLSFPPCQWLERGVGTSTMPIVNVFPSYTITKYSGLENLQLYDSDFTQTGGQIQIGQCMYCWVTGVETNFTNGDHIDVAWSYHPEVRDNYLTGAKFHTSGVDSDLLITNITTGGLFQNNIEERLHSGVMLSGGAAGNVVAYNYALGLFDQYAPGFQSEEMYSHAAGSNMNLFEGNVSASTKFDSIHGGSVNFTVFRQWMRLAGVACGPINGNTRTVPTCSPIISVPAGGFSGQGGWFQTSQIVGYDFSRLNYYNNIIGTISGSVTSTANIPSSTVVPQLWAVCDSIITTNCGLNSRHGGPGNRNDIYWGYGNSGDGGDVANCVGKVSVCGNGQANGPGPGSGASCASWILNATPPNCDIYNISASTQTTYNTTLVHGVYTHTNGVITWAPGITHTLPASFYLTSKPAWFGNAPFPPIGPDVTGGLADGYGHTNKIPAILCYEGPMGGKDTLNGGMDSANSPLTFDANTCYSTRR